MGDFDRETAVRADGDDRWTAQVSPDWNIGTVPNGGYSLSIVLAAMRAAGGYPDPVSVTCHYLRPVVAEAPATVVTDVVRTGRTVATVTGRLEQEGSVRLFAVAALGTLGDASHDVEPGPPGWAELAMPDLPRPEDCVARSGDAQGVDLPLARRVEVRVHPDLADLSRPDPGRGAEVTGWIRCSDDRPVDTAALVLFADAFPPSLFGRLGPVGWVPTLELTVHVRARPVPGWIRGAFRTDDLRDGRMVEDGALWDSAGRLVCRSRQLGLLRTT